MGVVAVTVDELNALTIVELPLPDADSGLRDWGELDLDHMGAAPAKLNCMYAGPDAVPMDRGAVA